MYTETLTPLEEVLISRFIEVVRDSKDVESVYLFGSRARGEGSIESDIDIAVIVKDREVIKDITRLVVDASIKIVEELGISGELTLSPIVIDEALLNGQVLSSLYYGYFHLIKALLYQKGFDPISHEGVYSMLNLHFIKAGTLDKKYSRLFEQLHKAREIADYNPLAPKYDKRDASGYIRTFSELVPGIIEMIRNYDKYSMPVTKSVEELRLLTLQ